MMDSLKNMAKLNLLVVMLFIYATDIDYLRRLFQGPENGNFWGLES